MSSKILSVCILAKDAVGTIGRAIGCVHAHADEVLVGDTGSTDGTREAACAAGAKVVDIVWQNHFANARNDLLTHATGQWVLSLDSDEVVLGAEVESLRRFLESPLALKYLAYEIEKRSYIDGEANLYRSYRCSGDYPEFEYDYPSYISEPNLLLFRRDEVVRWSGAVHESVLRSLPTAQGSPAVMRLPSLVVHNYGRASGAQGKWASYRGLVETRIAEDPLDPVSWFYQALLKESDGDIKAAERYYKSSIKLQKTSYGLYGLASMYLRTGQYQQAELSFVNYLRYCPEDSQAWTAVLLCSLKMEDPGRLEFYLANALKTEVANKQDLIKFAAYSAKKLNDTKKVKIYEQLLKETKGK